MEAGRRPRGKGVGEPLLAAFGGGAGGAGQAPALPPRPPLQKDLERGIHPEGILAETPVEPAAEAQAGAVANGDRLLAFHSHPADEGGADAGQAKGAGHIRLGELDLQGQGVQEGAPGGTAGGEAAREAAGQQGDEEELKGAPGPPPPPATGGWAGGEGAATGHAGGAHWLDASDGSLLGRQGTMEAL
jgi:hypothetical protein